MPKLLLNPVRCLQKAPLVFYKFQSAVHAILEQILNYYLQVVVALRTFLKLEGEHNPMKGSPFRALTHTSQE